jgi:hypothetical protein
VTRAEELAEKVRRLPSSRYGGLTGTAEAALSELVADAEALAEALEQITWADHGSAALARDALARYRGEKP